MAFKSIKKELYMIPQTIVGENIGIGNGSMTAYMLPVINIKVGTLKVYLNSTLVEDTDYTFENETGTITFNTAPVAEAVITVDYDLSKDDLIFTATATAIVIGLQVCNKDQGDAGAVTIKVANKYLSYKMVIPPFSSLVPISGKLVLEAGDEVRAHASDDDMLDLILSYMEV